MFGSLVSSLTAIMIMGNVSGIYYTSWWSVIGMFLGGAVISGAFKTAMEQQKQEKQQKAIAESEKIAKQCLEELASAIEKTQRNNDKDLH
jgi:membrane protein implicated in regulation of membrane protease activity